MRTDRVSAIVLAALELLPAEPSDLSGLLADPVQRDALLTLTPDGASSSLTDYLCTELDQGRVERWEKRLHLYGHELEDAALLLYGSDEYPTRLAACWDRPPLLFVQGKLESPGQVGSVAVVGSREASPHTCEESRQLARAVAGVGASIVSGLAAGVDTAAHLGALDGDGHTVAVFGTGIRRIFPEENAGLAERIKTSGAIVSQFPPDAPRTATTFLRRNNVIAGLADVSIVMDGRARSGSRHQAEQAARYGRTVLLWERTLRDEIWAQDMASRGLAAFAGSVHDVLEHVL